MADVKLPDSGTIALGTALVTGLGLLLRAAFRVGVKETADQRIAADLAEIKADIKSLKAEFAAHSREDLERLARIDERMEAMRRASRPDFGE